MYSTYIYTTVQLDNNIGIIFEDKCTDIHFILYKFHELPVCSLFTLQNKSPVGK
jgi:hypothetical protein